MWHFPSSCCCNKPLHILTVYQFLESRKLDVNLMFWHFYHQLFVWTKTKCDNDQTWIYFHSPGCMALYYPFILKIRWRRERIAEESYCGYILHTMWLACYSPGCVRRPVNHGTHLTILPKKPGPVPGFMTADRADVNVLPAALSSLCSSTPQRLQAGLMSFQIQLLQNNNTLTNSLGHTNVSFISSAPFSFTMAQRCYCVHMQTEFRQTSYSYWHRYAFE